MAKKIVLLPCPFCGGKAKLIDRRNFCYVMCKKCKIESPVVATSTEYCARDRAIKYWNERV